jgi:hypothetical protein
MFLEAASSNRVQETQCAETIDIASVFSHLKRNFDVRLSTEVIDLRRLNLGDDVDKVGTIAQITVMKVKFIRPCSSTMVNA